MTVISLRETLPAEAEMREHEPVSVLSIRKIREMNRTDGPETEKMEEKVLERETVFSGMGGERENEW